MRLRLPKLPLSLLDRIPVRLRLSLAHAIWMALIFGGIGWGVYRLVALNLYQSVDAALIASAQTIREARFNKGFGSPLMRQFLDEFMGDTFIRSYAQLVDLSGNVSASTNPDRLVNLPVTPTAVARAEQGLETIESFQRHKKAALRQVTIPVMHRGKFTGELIQIGAPLDGVHQTLRSISLLLWVVMPCGLILSIGFGYLLTARAFRPVKLISNAAKNLGADDLSRRLPLPEANDELQDLTRTFNSMLHRLDDAFRRLRRFAGDVSHELRTPLTVLRGEAEFALRRERSGADYKQSLTTILAESKGMTDIVEDLLLLARAQGKAIRIEKQVIEPKEFVEQMKQTCEVSLLQKNINLRASYQMQGTIWASPGYLGLAVRNILSNAVKHSPENSEIEVSISAFHGWTDIKVRDHGPGIAEDAIPYVFDPFYREDTARNRAAGGTGIGLALAQALVKLHGGTISVHSRKGSGATFVVTIPSQARRANHPAKLEESEQIPLHPRRTPLLES